jgi:enamine deaminase RidA (YjgF/YER057c/UK114 family)
MSHLKYYAYDGAGVEKRTLFSYSQAVRVGDRIECAGQGEPPNDKPLDSTPFLFLSESLLVPPAAKTKIPGGWHADGRFELEINAQIDLAFANVEKNLLDAGGKGWSQVYRVNSYHVPLNNEALSAMVRNFKKWMPDHQPVWTCVGVTRLGEDDMRVEIEVVAHDPEGAEAAKTA